MKHPGQPLFRYDVDVETLIQKDGRMVPLAVFWNHRRYPIEKITAIKDTYSAAGGCGTRYTCRISGQIRQLFWERNHWFIESRRYIPSSRHPS